MTSGQAHNINLFTVKTASDLCIIRKQRKLTYYEDNAKRQRIP